jgi:hypothetical protein
MPASLADSAVVARMPQEVQDAILVCAVALEKLANEDQRLVIAVLMAEVKLGQLTPGERQLH